MPPLRSSSDSESESDAPEAVSLVQSKKHVQNRNADIRKAQSIASEKQKSKNREKDRRLKERAEQNRRGGATSSKNKQELEKGAEINEIEARMLRAMRDAEEDMDEDEEFGDMGSSEPSDMDEDDDSEGENVDSEEEQESDSLESSEGQETRSVTAAQHYLPDEVFKAAFANARTDKSSESKKKLAPSRQRKQEKRKRRAAKDVIIGSKVIRALPPTTAPLTSRTAAVPSSKINKFLNRALALNGGKRGTVAKSWERRPANVGVLRRNGPAAQFVRK